MWQQYFKVVSQQQNMNSAWNFSRFQFSQILKLSTIKGQIRNFHSGRTGQELSEKVMQEWQKSESKSEKVTVRGGGQACASFRQDPGLVQTPDDEGSKKANTHHPPPRNHQPLANSLCQTRAKIIWKKFWEKNESEIKLWKQKWMKLFFQLL